MFYISERNSGGKWENIAKTNSGIGNVTKKRKKYTFLEKECNKVFEVEVKNIKENQFQAVLAKELILEYCNNRFEMRFISQNKKSVSAGRGIRFKELEELRNIRILADVSSVEVFLNDGEVVFSTRYYPKKYEIQIEAPNADIVYRELKIKITACTRFFI